MPLLWARTRWKRRVEDTLKIALDERDGMAGIHIEPSVTFTEPSTEPPRTMQGLLFSWKCFLECSAW